MYVYAITNPAFDGWVKVGMSKHPESRLNSLSTGSPMDYELQHTVELVSDKFVHCYLENEGIERVREWFKCDLQAAIDAINTVKDELPEYVTDSYHYKWERESVNDNEEIRLVS